VITDVTDDTDDTDDTRDAMPAAEVRVNAAWSGWQAPCVGLPVMSKTSRIFLTSAVIAASAALSGCDFFKDVVIPVTDTTAPSIWNGVYDPIANQYISLTADPGEATYNATLDDLSNTYWMVGAIIDEGGAHDVAIKGAVDVVCYRFSPGRLEFSHRFFPFTDSDAQQGKVGDTVSDGLYAASSVRFDQYVRADHTSPYCDASQFWNLSYVSATWQTSGGDFHGNRSDEAVTRSGGGTVQLNVCIPVTQPYFHCLGD
jgi:hypothetical protein